MSDIESQYADIGDGLRLHYHDIGKGTPIVFLHGSGPGASSISNFRGNYKTFADAGYRAILVDSPGYGKSSKPADGSYHVSALCNAIIRFLDTLSIDRCILIGNSLGGAMALRLAIDHPKRIKSLVLLAPGGLANFSVYAAMPGIQKLIEVGLAAPNATLEDMRKLFSLQLFDPAFLSEELLTHRLEVAKTQPKSVYSGLRVPDMSSELDLLRCPVLALWGANDQFCPVSTSSVLLEKIAKIQVVQVGECGHWVQVEHADLFNRTALQFLNEHEQKQ